MQNNSIVQLNCHKEYTVPKFYTLTTAMLSTQTEINSIIQNISKEKISHLTIDLTDAYPNTCNLAIEHIISNIGRLLDSLYGNLLTVRIERAWGSIDMRPEQKDRLRDKYLSAIIGTPTGSTQPPIPPICMSQNGIPAAIPQRNADSSLRQRHTSKP